MLLANYAFVCSASFCNDSKNELAFTSAKHKPIVNSIKSTFCLKYAQIFGIEFYSPDQLSRSSFSSKILMFQACIFCNLFKTCVGTFISALIAAPFSG
jgi:hypothetical protein